MEHPANPDTNCDIDAFNLWYKQHRKAHFTEGDVVIIDQEDQGPLLLSEGRSILVHAGKGLHHGGSHGAPDGSETSFVFDGFFAYSRRNTSFTDTGPMHAAQLLHVLSKHVAVEAARNHVLTNALQHLQAVDSNRRWEMPGWPEQYFSHGVIPTEAEKVRPLEGPAADKMSEAELLRVAAEELRGERADFAGLYSGKDGVVALWKVSQTAAD